MVLSKAVFSVNVLKQSSSHFSPFKLVHDYVPNLPGQLNIGTVEAGLDETTRLRKLSGQLRAAKAKSENSQALAKSRYDASSKTLRFKIGGSIYCSIGMGSSMTDQFLEGPLKIKSSPTPNTVIIKSLHSIKG
ncbi:hypothetical protein ISCGN_023843 [Ixodes scapularis]